jgi:hypothetical protein
MYPARECLFVCSSRPFWRVAFHHDYLINEFNINEVNMKNLVFLFWTSSTMSLATTIPIQDISKDEATAVYNLTLPEITAAGCATEASLVGGRYWGESPQGIDANYVLFPESGKPIILRLIIERGGAGANVVAVSCDGSESPR